MGLIEATTILFFGYLGFDFITTISEEAVNPKRDVPLAIQYSVVISMLIYALVAFSVQGVASLASVGTGDGETALAEIFSSRGMEWMSTVIFICALLGITAAAFTNLMS
jgi:APA family basic amino acid/polyamine antiporter